MSDLDRPPATLPTSARASAADRACFARVARANTLLEDARPPASFRETLARMEALRAMLPEGAANAGERAGEDDLESHLAYLRRMREGPPAAKQAAAATDAAIRPPADTHGDR
jgi:hypothetical protein